MESVIAKTTTKGRVRSVKDLLEKIGAYNLFNYLLPGCVFAVIAEHYKLLVIRQGETISDLLIFYFVGLVITCCLKSK
jgi:hypothetical protein